MRPAPAFLLPELCHVQLPTVFKARIKGCDCDDAPCAATWLAAHVHDYLSKAYSHCCFPNAPQGKVDFGSDMQITRRVLSGIFILVTTVYGYIISHRTINAVLKEAAKQEEQECSNGGSGSGGGAKVNGVSQAGVALMAAHERERMRDIEAAGSRVE